MTDGRGLKAPPAHPATLVYVCIMQHATSASIRSHCKTWHHLALSSLHASYPHTDTHPYCFPPSSVDKNNWSGEDTNGDTFSVEVASECA